MLGAGNSGFSSKFLQILGPISFLGGTFLCIIGLVGFAISCGEKDDLGRESTAFEEKNEEGKNGIAKGKQVWWMLMVKYNHYLGLNSITYNLAS